MHDLIEYEVRGIPSVMVASSEFVHAANRQAVALGLPSVAERAVFVPHPIQDASDDDVCAKADAALDAIVTALTMD